MRQAATYNPKVDQVKMKVEVVLQALRLLRTEWAAA